MAVHLRDRELLAQLVAVTVVRTDVNRPFERERLIQTVQLSPNRFLPALNLRDPLRRIGLQLPPGVHHAVLDEAHEASCWLKAREFLDEQLLEFGLADVHRATAAAAAEPPLQRCAQRASSKSRRCLPGNELTVEPHASRPGEEGREFVDTTIDVKDHDLHLSLTVERGASLTGQVVAEPSRAITTPIGLRVMVNKAHEQLAAGLTIAAAVNGDWEFRMTGLSGSYEFFVSSDRPPPMVVATRVVIDGKSYPATGGIALSKGDHDVVVFVAPREAPKPTVDATQSSTALVEQLKHERTFWKQIEIAKAIAGKHSLGQIGDKRAIAPLMAALDNDDPSNRVLVIYALEALDAKEAVPRLLTLVTDDRKSRFGALVTVSEAAKAAIAKLQ